MLSNKNLVLRFNVILMVTFLFYSISLGQEKGVDTVIFKSEATLPQGIKSTEVKCIVLEDTTETVKVDISLLNGIKDLRNFSKSSIEKIILADRSILEFKLLEPALTQSPSSFEASVYDDLFKNKVEPFLKKHPASQATPQMQQVAQALKRESYLVRLGWGRVGDQWLQPDEMKIHQEEVMLENLMTELKDIQIKVGAGDYGSLAGLASRISSFKNNIYYPYLINGLRSVVRPAGQAVPLDLVNLQNDSVSTLMEASSKFESAKLTIREIQRKQIEDPEVLVNPLRDLAFVALNWPELKQLIRFLELNNRYLLDAFWMASFRGYAEAEPVPYMKLLEFWRTLSETEVLPITLRLAVNNEVQQIKVFHSEIYKFFSEQNYPALTQLSLPEGVVFSEKLKTEYAKIGTLAQSKIASASDLFKKGKEAYDANQLTEAGVQWKESYKIWPRNPDLILCRDKLLEKVALMVKKRERQEANQQMLILKQVWPEDEKVSAADANLQYSRSYLDLIDNYTTAIIGFIVLCAIAGFFGMRFIVRAISE